MCATACLTFGESRDAQMIVVFSKFISREKVDKVMTAKVNFNFLFEKLEVSLDNAEFMKIYSKLFNIFNAEINYI